MRKTLLVGIVVLTGMVAGEAVGGDSYEAQARATSSEECTRTSSSFVHEVCYDKGSQVLRLLLNSSYYNYCGVPESVYRALLSASSKGRYFNQSIKGRFRC